MCSKRSNYLKSYTEKGNHFFSMSLAKKPLGLTEVRKTNLKKTCRNSEYRGY